MISEQYKIFAVVFIVWTVIMNRFMGKHMPSITEENYRQYMLLWGALMIINLIVEFYIGFKIIIKFG